MKSIIFPLLLPFIRSLSLFYLLLSSLSLLVFTLLTDYNYAFLSKTLMICFV